MREEDTTLLSDAFLTDVTEKMNHLNIGKDKHISDMIRAVKAVALMANPFVDVDINEISGQASLFCVDPVEMEIEIINIQNVQLKSQQHSQDC